MPNNERTFMPYRLYYQEVKPTIALLPNAIYSWIDGIMNEREQDLDVVHPVPPNKVRSNESLLPLRTRMNDASSLPSFLILLKDFRDGSGKAAPKVSKTKTSFP